LGVLHARFGAAAFERDDPPLRDFAGDERKALARLLAAGRFAPETSSAGRLFDATAALLGVRQRCSWEGQAALELESLAATDREQRAYPMALHGDELDWRPLLDALLADRDAGVPTGVVAMRFHRGLACGIVTSARRTAQETGIRRVVLTGGCFQNALLSELSRAGLVEAGLEPLLHHRVPPNDGGLAVGQILAAAAASRRAARTAED
jgi:hydrogenase maturation protein HypF